MSRCTVQIFRTMIIAVIDEASSFAIQIIRPISVRKAGFQRYQFQSCDVGSFPEMTKPSTVVNPEQLWQRVVGGVPSPGSTVHFIDYKIDRI